MVPLPKLDWFPMDLAKLKGSEPYRTFSDYQFGWYMRLLIESYDSERPGYLPNDDSVLWRIAGARTKAYFQREGQSVLSRFSGRTEDGAWIYHPRVLKTLNCQSKRLKVADSKESRKEDDTLFISLSSLPVLDIYKDYPRKEGRKAALESIRKAIGRYAKEQQIDPMAAAEFIHKAVIEFAQSPAGHRRAKDGSNLVPHPSTWFNQDRFLDDREEWRRESFDADYEKRVAQATVGVNSWVFTCDQCGNGLPNDDLGKWMTKDPARQFCSEECKAKYLEAR